MFLRRAAVPVGDGFAVLVEQRFAADPREQRVAAFDVFEVFDDRFGRVDVAAGAEVPLEVADPEDEVGDGGGAGVDLDAEELVGVDGVAAFEEHLPLGDAFVGAEDFAFDALEVFQRDVEEVAGAAGGVEDVGFAEAVVEGFELLHGFVALAFAGRGGWRRRGRRPIPCGSAR